MNLEVWHYCEDDGFNNNHILCKYGLVAVSAATATITSEAAKAKQLFVRDEADLERRGNSTS